MSKRIHLTQKYPESKTIREALLKRNKLNRKIAVCQHDQIDYKSMSLLARKSVKVIENLAKAVASLEERNKVSEESLIGFLIQLKRWWQSKTNKSKNYRKDWR